MRVDVDTVRTEYNKMKHKVYDLTNSYSEKVDNVNQMQTIMRSASAHRELAKSELNKITEQEQQDKKLISSDIENLNLKIEKERQVRSFLRSQMAKQDQLLELYEQVKIDEQQKVDNLEARNQRFENDNRCHIMTDADMQTSASIIAQMLEALRVKDHPKDQNANQAHQTPQNQPIQPSPAGKE